MIILINNKTYSMTKVQADGLLKIASEAVPFGIYAVKKGKQIQMLNMPLDSRTKLKASIRDFKNKGYKVYSNGL